ncbi:MAG TPA: thioredoxin domain-containing protein [Candidatus Hypogeohydataceae bacterium YC41]
MTVFILLLILLIPAGAVAAEEEPLASEAKIKGNRLAKAKSPYLLSAKNQQIEWYEFGEEAFQKAKELDRPILLDIGAIWCHWCHVMDEGTYEDPEVAELINKLFVAIKVDRDERPDIDRKYQEAVETLTGHGGWPLTAFLTPEAKVFYGGTYFPPEDQAGREGMKTLLPRIAQLYKEKKAEVLAMAEQHHEELLTLGIPKPDKLSQELLDGTASAILAEGDTKYGGFGTVSKFPSASAVGFLLNRGFTKKEEAALNLALKTLDEMAKGGIKDHIRGGFFRYTVDPEWHVPHFEKMSYVQAGMIVNYIHGYAATGKDLYKEVAEDVLDYVRREASDEEQGGFYASQDADIGRGDDGDYYTWTPDEVEKALPHPGGLEAKAIMAFYGIETQGEMEHNPAKNVLRIMMDNETLAKELGIPVDEVPHLLQTARMKLREARDAPPRPIVDKNKYTNWNGMMIFTWLEAYKFLGDTTIRDFALKSLDFLLEKSYRKGQGFFHVYQEGEARIKDLLDDNVQMAKACLDGYEVSGQVRYLQTTLDIMDYCVREFWDSKEGGFYDLPITATEIKRKPFEDIPTPAANPTAAMVLDRLYYITHEARYYDIARKTLQAFAGSALESGYFAASYALALDYHLNPPVCAIIIGKKADPQTRVLQEAALATYRPGKIVTVHDPTEEGSLPYPPSPEGKPIVYVCIPLNTCLPPTSEPKKMQELLKTLGDASIKQ